MTSKETFFEVFPIMCVSQRTIEKLGIFFSSCFNDDDEDQRKETTSKKSLLPSSSSTEREVHWPDSQHRLPPIAPLHLCHWKVSEWGMHEAGGGCGRATPAQTDSLPCHAPGKRTLCRAVFRYTHIHTYTEKPGRNTHSHIYIHWYRWTDRRMREEISFKLFYRVAPVNMNL